MRWASRTVELCLPRRRDVPQPQDRERAAEGPFGGTIAHGYLTLSLIPSFGSQLFELANPGAKLNYGVN